LFLCGGEPPETTVSSTAVVHVRLTDPERLVMYKSLCSCPTSPGHIFSFRIPRADVRYRITVAAPWALDREVSGCTVDSRLSCLIVEAGSSSWMYAVTDDPVPPIRNVRLEPVDATATCP
jgi:hypothetical protein